MYVYELAAGGVAAFEEGFASGNFPPAVLLESSTKSRHDDPAKRKELAAGQLSQPGGIAIVDDDLYVTDGVFTAGRLLEIDK